MSLAAACIADLDEEIDEQGQAITLVRIVSNAPKIREPFRAIVRGYRPVELVGGIQHGDTLAILSPTGLPTAFADTDATRLRRNDSLVIDGRSRIVEFIEPVRVADTLVRMNVTVRG